MSPYGTSASTAISLREPAEAGAEDDADLRHERAAPAHHVRRGLDPIVQRRRRRHPRSPNSIVPNRIIVAPFLDRHRIVARHAHRQLGQPVAPRAPRRRAARAGDGRPVAAPPTSSVSALIVMSPDHREALQTGDRLQQRRQPVGLHAALLGLVAAVDLHQHRLPLAVGATRRSSSAARSARSTEWISAKRPAACRALLRCSVPIRCQATWTPARASCFSSASWTRFSPDVRRAPPRPRRAPPRGHGSW